MQRSIQSQSYNLSGYSGYQFVREFKGIWVPFNQTTAGYVGVLSIFKTVQKRHHLPDRVTDAAACQGISLKYIENGCSLRNLSTASPESGKIHPASLAAAVNYQAKCSGTLEARQALTDPDGKIQCQSLSVDNYPRKWALNQILNRIAESNGNVFYLTGYCTGLAWGKVYEGAHAFVITRKGNAWRFFEAQRGEVVFSCFDDFSAWIMKESLSGSLKDLNTLRPVEVKPDVIRYYHAYTLDIYHKDFTQEKLMARQPSEDQGIQDETVFKCRL